MLQRESTGIPKLDEVIGGGLPRPSITAVIGPPGVGTTSFCKKFIVSSLQRGKRTVVALGDVPPDHFMRHFEPLKYLDIRSLIDEKKLLFLDVYAYMVEALGIRDFSDVGTFDAPPLDKIFDETRFSISDQVAHDVRGINLVLDSITSLSPFIGIRDVHRMILAAQNSARENNLVLIFTAHEGALEGNLVQVLRQYVDGIIRMRMHWVRGSLQREMIIEKMRFTEIREPILQYEITDEGIEIL
ncbi:MAG: ATPase domain-containing protein [Promethearchaeati archaeon SRVP18_Atabeyarchaeia-1]